MTTALRVLLDGLIDYAGLFPPARRAMPDAVREYAAHRTGAHAWMLGRFVVPASRLGEFARAAEARWPPAGDPWRLSVLLGDDAAADVAAIAAFNAAHAGALCDAVEARTPVVADVERVAGAVRGAPVTAYAEIPVAADPAPLVAAISRHGLRAKIRTGGITGDAFPEPVQVVRFLGACIRAKVPFKATAGLHHPMRGEFPMTYEPGSPTARMFGFLNVFLAAALLRDGASEDEACSMLTEQDPASVTFTDRGAEWRGRLVLSTRLAQLRAVAAVSFGSCSFDEPVRELTDLRFVA